MRGDRAIGRRIHGTYSSAIASDTTAIYYAAVETTAVSTTPDTAANSGPATTSIDQKRSRPYSSIASEVTAAAEAHP